VGPADNTGFAAGKEEIQLLKVKDSVGDPLVSVRHTVFEGPDTTPFSGEHSCWEN